MISAKRLCDYICDGNRLVTWELTYPRFIHSEVMTHRVFAKNAASSRAIPAKTLRKRVLDNPAIPIRWGKNQKGMQAEHELSPMDADRALEWWLRGRDLMVKHHEEGEELGLHKQIVNRVIEPWMPITVIFSGTEWANLFHLRDHKQAEDNFQLLARKMREEFFENMPKEITPGEWSLPFITYYHPKAEGDDVTAVERYLFEGAAAGKWYATQVPELMGPTLRAVSTGRCARVSYLTHDGRRDIREDIRLHDDLLATSNADAPGHFSPFEHPAMAVGGDDFIGPFRGWKQYRKFFAKEAGPDTTKRCKRCGSWRNEHVAGCTRAMMEA